MLKKICLPVLYLFLLGLMPFVASTQNAVNAQKDNKPRTDKQFTDHRPQYRKWQDSYILDKIEYTKDRTIFYFRFVNQYDPLFGGTTDAIFYPPGGEHPWYLRGKNVRKDFELIEIKNVKRNGKLEAARVRSELKLNALPRQNTVFTCEVHFERLPNDLEYVDFIEGRGKENATNHFNCFNVKLKTWDSPELGDKKDSEEAAEKFNKKFGVKTDPKPDPKVEPEPKKDTTKPKPVVVDSPKTKEVIVVKEGKKLKAKGDIVCNEAMIAENLKFQDNSTEFLGMAAANATLVHMLEFMHDNPEATIVVSGHTDIHGDAEKNMELSHLRAVKIERWFIGNGLLGKRITSEAYGGTRPIKAEGSPINRRVEIFIKCDKK
jgi:outer membrane protein OmpA-like peptidoglycan-associated protein